MPRADRVLRYEPFDGWLAAGARRVTGVAFGLVVHALVRLDTSSLPSDLMLGRRALLVTNHRSPLDYLVVVCLCCERGRWPAMFAREDFFAARPSRYLLRTLALIPAARGRSAPEGLRRAVRLLDRGQVVAIAAEGGLVHAADRPDGVGRFRGGAGRLAVDGADVTVMTITGADEAWPPRRRLPRVALPWRRPAAVVRVRRVAVDPRWSPAAAGAAIRAEMVDLVAPAGPAGPAVVLPGG